MVLKDYELAVFDFSGTMPLPAVSGICSGFHGGAKRTRDSEARAVVSRAG